MIVEVRVIGFLESGVVKMEAAVYSADVVRGDGGVAVLAVMAGDSSEGVLSFHLWHCGIHDLITICEFFQCQGYVDVTVHPHTPE